MSLPHARTNTNTNVHMHICHIHISIHVCTLEIKWEIQHVSTISCSLVASQEFSPGLFPWESDVCYWDEPWCLTRSDFAQICLERCCKKKVYLTSCLMWFPSVLVQDFFQRDRVSEEETQRYTENSPCSVAFEGFDGQGSCWNNLGKWRVFQIVWVRRFAKQPDSCRCDTHSFCGKINSLVTETRLVGGSILYGAEPSDLRRLLQTFSLQNLPFKLSFPKGEVSIEVWRVFHGFLEVRSELQQC